MEGSVIDLSGMIDSCYRLREKADYDDFFLVARNDAVIQLEKAKYVVQTVSRYIQTVK